MSRFTGLLLILGMVCFGCSPPAGDVEQREEESTLQETAPAPATNETVVPSEPAAPVEEPMPEPAEEPAESPTPEPMAEAAALPPSVEQVPANEPKEMPVEEPAPPAEQPAPPAEEMKPEEPVAPAETDAQVDVEAAVQPTPADEVEGLLEEAGAIEAKPEPMPEPKAETEAPAEAEAPAETAEPMASPQTSQPAAEQAKMEKPEEGNQELASTGPVTTKLSAENTLIQFVGTHKGDKPDPRTGTFNRFHGEAKAAGGKLDSVTIEIETESLKTEIDKLTNHLKSPDFFDVRQHPKATFKSTKIEPADAGMVTITGDLTLLGTTKSITFPAKVTVENDVNLITEFTIDRTEFGMDYGADNVHKEIAMTVKVGK